MYQLLYVMQRPLLAIVPFLLWAAMLGGCDDHILPADEEKVWGTQRIVFSDVPTSGSRILTMQLDGGTPDASMGITGQLLYYPQGGHLLYSVVNSQDNTSFMLFGPGGAREIISESNYYVYIYLDRPAALTFDAQTVAYVAKHSLWAPWRLYLHELGVGGDTITIDDDIGEVSSLLFSREGRFLAVNTIRTGDTEERVYIYDRTTRAFAGPVERLIPGDFLGYTSNWFQWMPDGVLLYAGSDYSGNPGLYSMPGEGGYPHRIAGGQFSFPTPSSTGTQIAFIRENGLWIMNADGSGQRRLLQPDSTLFQSLIAPQWSPDDSKILITRILADANNSITALVNDVIDVRTGRYKSLTTAVYPSFWLK